MANNQPVKKTVNSSLETLYKLNRKASGLKVQSHYTQHCSSGTLELSFSNELIDEEVEMTEKLCTSSARHDQRVKIRLEKEGFCYKCQRSSSLIESPFQPWEWQS